jgi:hypothetical protein
MGMNPVSTAVEAGLSKAVRTTEVKQATVLAPTHGLRKDTLSFAGNSSNAKAPKGFWPKIKYYFSQFGNWLKGFFSSSKSSSTKVTPKATQEVPEPQSSKPDNTTSSRTNPPPAELPFEFPEAFQQLPYDLSSRTRFPASELKNNPNIQRLAKLDEKISDIGDVKPGDTVRDLCYSDTDISLVDTRTPKEVKAGEPIRTFASKEAMQEAEQQDKDLKVLLAKYKQDVENLQKFGKSEYDKVIEQHIDSIIQNNIQLDAEVRPTPYNEALKWAQRKVKNVQSALSQRKEQRLRDLEGAEKCQNMSKQHELADCEWGTDDLKNTKQHIEELFK